MEELRCVECGEIITGDVNVCPKCGCPVLNHFNEKNKKDENMEKNISVIKSRKQGDNSIAPLFSLIIGLVIIVIGLVVLTHKAGTELYDARVYDVEKASFGADFYTEIYGASEVIVDELNDINGGMELLSNSIVDIINAIYYGIGMLIISIGLGIISISLKDIKKR